MLYRAIGLMSGSSMDGLDIAFTEFQENGGKWSFEIVAANCVPYSEEWLGKLRTATTLSALDYQLLHTEYGHYLGEQVNEFINRNQLDYRVALVASHGHTSFHLPAKRMTAQLGDGAAIAATTQLPVVSDLRSMDVAFGGQGAPIVPIGEKLLFPQYSLFLNIGGIANISIKQDQYVAFDVCAANRILDLLAAGTGRPYDENGYMASSGTISQALLDTLNNLSYYSEPAPKSLANSFGTDTVYPLIVASGLSVYDALATYTEHIAMQVTAALSRIAVLPTPQAMKATAAPADTKGLPTPQAIEASEVPEGTKGLPILVTGGGALNTFLVERLTHHLSAVHVEVVVPSSEIIQYKEAVIMALAGVLRWREENTVLSSVTGARRDSVGGALWMGQEG